MAEGSGEHKELRSGWVSSVETGGVGVDSVPEFCVSAPAAPSSLEQSPSVGAVETVTPWNQA